MTQLNILPKILIVDDAPDVLDLLDRTFRRQGYETAPFERGIDATIAVLEAYRTGQCYNVLVLDCALPHFDGFTIAKIVRLAEKTEVTDCRARIIVYTAYPKTVEKSTLIEDSEVDAYFVKSQDEEKMVAQITNWVKEAVSKND